MPPFGLYQIPRHHLNAQSPVTSRPVYNSLDFIDDKAELSTTPNDGSINQLEGAVDDGDKSLIEKEKREEQRGMRRQEKKEKKRQSMKANTKQEVGQAITTPGVPLVNQTPTTSNPNPKKSKDGKTNDVVVGVSTSKKKRKRDSGTRDDTSTSLRQGPSMHGFSFSTDFLEGLKSTMGDPGAGFDRSSNPAQASKPLSKKKTKLNRKSEVTNNASKITGKVTDAVVYTPTLTGGRGKGKVGKSRDSMITKPLNIPSEEAVPSTTSPYVSVPRKTPVPLPQNTNRHPRSILRKTQQKEAPNEPAESQVLVIETPPSKQVEGVPDISRKPIPFNLLRATVPSSPQRTTSKKKLLPVSLSSPTIENGETFEPTPVPLPKTHRLTVKPSGRVSLTTSNLMRYTEPLNDEPKPRLRASSVAASTAGSTTSSMSSMSIKEAFSRIAKPYTRSGAEIDPFIVPETKKKKRYETHDEASLEVFVQKFRPSRNTVNFTHEQEYLNTHFCWRAQNDAAGPLPCLGQATGCTPKREIVLRLHKEDTPNALRVLVTTDRDARVLSDATQRSASAETFLQLAVAARIPVPIGRVEGTWTLFCPKYSDTHVDKYGFGKRTLTIHSIAGFKDQNTYTARLSIPPRSMLYNILSFSAPPHASLRTTTLRTAVEGYKMEAVFLGNGYLQLRVDLNLLLRGKPTETAEGKPVYMEFLGVHEEAVRWREEKDELEEVGRKLFAKYDGVAGED